MKYCSARVWISTAVHDPSINTIKAHPLAAKLFPFGNIPPSPPANLPAKTRLKKLSGF